MFLADLHVHSTFSDGRLTVSELVDLYGGLGFGAIAITDHVCEQRTLLGKAAHLLKAALKKSNFHEYLQVLKQEAIRPLD